MSSIPASAIATEFDVMNTSTPSLNYLIDDAGVLNKTTKKSVNDRLYKLEASPFHSWPLSTLCMPLPMACLSSLLAHVCLSHDEIRFCGCHGDASHVCLS